jgi:AraC family transcriptional regulator, regulatory protein of adaptative response / methylated-DNA-[protein]-cysteine methyltransferase
MATMAVEPVSLPSDAEAWRAVADRDARFDGQFVYAVRTTNVYCRPSCASRRPKRENVSFFESADEAEAAGFRPCLRCDPRGGRTEPMPAAVERARRYLEEHGDRVVSLSELARHAGLSASHLQRSFKRVVGVSPKEYQDGLRVTQLKARLRAGDTVSRATFEAGFGSSSRLYERSNELLGMTPASYRRGGQGVRIRYAIADAPVGRVLVGMTDRGVCAVELGATDADVERALNADFPNAAVERSDETEHEWVRAVLERVREPARHGVGGVPLDVAGTAFQLRVWKALQAIPAGERRSYAQVAESIGEPTATRAVARACATNRVAVVIPCHRVVRGDGSLSGYKWGVERKRQLLDDEAG